MQAGAREIESLEGSQVIKGIGVQEKVVLKVRSHKRELLKLTQASESSRQELGETQIQPQDLESRVVGEGILGQNRNGTSQTEPLHTLPPLHTASKACVRLVTLMHAARRGSLEFKGQIRKRRETRGSQEPSVARQLKAVQAAARGSDRADCVAASAQPSQHQPGPQRNRITESKPLSATLPFAEKPHPTLSFSTCTYTVLTAAARCTSSSARETWSRVRGPQCFQTIKLLGN